MKHACGLMEMPRRALGGAFPLTLSTYDRSARLSMAFHKAFWLLIASPNTDKSTTR